MAKHIVGFSDFVNERLGVPDAEFNAARHLGKCLAAFVRDKSLTDSKYDRETLVVNDFRPSQDFPLKTITVHVSIAPGDFLNIAGATIMNGEHTDIELGGISAEMSVRVTTAYGMDLTREADLHKFTTALSSWAAHELMHVYDQFRRIKSKGDKAMIGDTADYLYTAMADQKAQDISKGSIIKQFLHLIYISARHETKAAVPEAFAYIADIKDPIERAEALKRTGPWHNAAVLLEFRADRFIEDVKKEAEAKGFNEQDATNMLESLVKHFGGMTQNNGRSEMFNRSVSGMAKEASGNYVTFFKMWEKRFTRAGTDLEARLLRLVRL